MRPWRGADRRLTTPSDPSTDLPTMLGWLAMLIAGGALAAISVELLPYWPIAHKRCDLLIGWCGEEVDELLRRADAALYEAKQAGGARTVGQAAPPALTATAPSPQRTRKVS